MAKMMRPVEWYEECLTHMRFSLQARLAMAKRQQDETDQLIASIGLMEYQIKEARRLGKPAFDGERFRVPRN